MSRYMRGTARVGMILASVIIIAILAFWAASGIPPPPPSPSAPPVTGDEQFYYTANTIISSINATLSVFLLAAYMELYRKTPSRFTMALIIVSIALLLNALAFNPYILWIFHFRGSGLGPFAVLPGMFTSITLIALLYLALKY